MLTFYLVRHGTKEAIPFDPPLTTVGEKQAEITRDLFENTKFEAIFSSTKLRTRMTAEIISKPHSQEIIHDERLIERLEWEKDQSFDEFINEWYKTDQDRSYKPNVGLSSNENGKRMKIIIEEMSSTYKDGNILIVTHGGSIGDLLRNLFGEENLPNKINPVTGLKYVEILECSITVVEKDLENYKLVKIGDISHLSVPLI